MVIEGSKVFIPGNVSIFPSWVAMHRSKIYGSDADVFRPERWIDEPDKDKLEAMKRVNDLQFGHSRYVCILCFCRL